VNGQDIAEGAYRAIPQEGLATTTYLPLVYANVAASVQGQPASYNTGFQVINPNGQAANLTIKAVAHRTGNGQVDGGSDVTIQATVAANGIATFDQRPGQCTGSFCTAGNFFQTQTLTSAGLWFGALTITADQPIGVVGNE